MDSIIPWDYWVNLIRPYYPSGKRGRLPKDIEIMLRMYLLQSWFSLSDIGIEDAIYDSFAMRKFMHINFMEEQIPNSTTLLHFRHLIEDNKIGEKIFEDVKERLCESLWEMERRIKKELEKGIDPNNNKITVLELVKKYVEQKT
ncbi:MAG: transposase, partial [Clostridiales bacterium]|nr:transposase [Clostridiales bacterium]